MRANNNKHREIFFYISFSVIIVLAIFFIMPFIKAILAALILAFVSYPLHNFIKKKIKSERFSAIIVTLIVFLIILIPFAFVLNQMVKESTVSFISLKQKISVTPSECVNQTSCQVINSFKTFISDPKVQYYLSSSLEKGLNYITEAASSFIISLPKVIMNVFITLIGLFYFLKDGPLFINKIRNLLPVKKQNIDLLFSRFVNISKSIVYGYVMTAIVQGFTALIGFLIANMIFHPGPGLNLINTPILWAIILAFLSMVPVLGSGFVWVPMSGALILQGYFDSNSTMVFGGIFIFFYGLILISNIDNVVRPILSGRKAKVHPLLLFLGIFGGLFVFGFMGILAGPLVLALLLTFAKMYEEGKI